MSFRAIVCYYYEELYNCNPQEIYFHELEKMVEKHAQVGLQNPVFSYDPQTMLWFVDFNRVGTAKTNAPFEEVIKTIDEMFEVFDMRDHIHQKAHDGTWDKFEKATTIFYEKRKRPKGRKMLIPTLDGCAGVRPEEFWEETREFTKINMKLK